MPKLTRADRIRGSIFGSAFGDAAGRPTEFMRIGAINERARTTPIMPSPALVTDDTMMMLAVGWALAPGPMSPSKAATALIAEYVSWFHAPQEGRAPGATCMRAIGKLARDPFLPWRAAAWQGASQVESKGCGANMRVQPVAYLRRSEDDRAGLAQLQAAITHGHPTALAAADLTQQAIYLVMQGVRPESLLGRLADYARRQRTIYRATWLGNLNEYVDLVAAAHPRRWIASGWDECLTALDRVQQAPTGLLPSDDPCKYTGEGWVAEEALATALYCFLRYPDSPTAVVERAARTGGDSDSIACLAGALAGAAHGTDRWPAHWMDRIEFRAELDQLAADLSW